MLRAEMFDQWDAEVSEVMENVEPNEMLVLWSSLVNVPETWGRGTTVRLRAIPEVEFLATQVHFDLHVCVVTKSHADDG